MDTLDLWNRYKRYLCACPSVGLEMDISRMDFPESYLAEQEPAIHRAYEAMARLESGAIANPDEGRMVGHYWLRAPELAPDQVMASTIRATVDEIKRFAAKVHAKTIKPDHAARFTDLLVIGIGGSALGPQLVADCLTTRRDRLRVHFLDNTDPDGFDRCFSQLGMRVKSTLTVVISKSGGTKETRNGMLEAQAAYERRNLDFAPHAVAVTGEGSELDQRAKSNRWIRTFPMWDWVGGRTSVMSAVGLLPAAVQGFDVDRFLDGAAAMDQLTRVADTKRNPAARLALMWYFGSAGSGAKDMVILPYKDRLLLLSRYLQQLVMESLGKELDVNGRPVYQGIAVYGNKGSTDQHAYVQQLREGVNNFFATFIVVLEDRAPAAAKLAPQVDPDTTSGDYLSGFWQGTRKALHDKGRGSVTITIDKLNASRLGTLIALFERAVGFYATLVNINAYHQPGVEAGKKAASAVVELQHKLVQYLESHPEPGSEEAIAAAIDEPNEVETVHYILEHLAANKRGVIKTRKGFRCKGPVLNPAVAPS